jgi:hypothetical protein
MLDRDLHGSNTACRVVRTLELRRPRHSSKNRRESPPDALRSGRLYGNEGLATGDEGHKAVDPGGSGIASSMISTGTQCLRVTCPGS